jgi:hypothetical protein
LYSLASQEHNDGMHTLQVSVSSVYSAIQHISQNMGHPTNGIQIPMVMVVVAPERIIPVQTSFCSTWKVTSVGLLVDQLT